MSARRGRKWTPGPWAIVGNVWVVGAILSDPGYFGLSMMAYGIVLQTVDYLGWKGAADGASDA